ncbi:MAG TPA: TonB-dependent receptor [Arenimonas sp.]|nr:TonB-dependent receptor [Arenimonas sp.]
MKKLPLALAIATLIAAPWSSIYAQVSPNQTSEIDVEIDELDRVQVTASPLRNGVDDMAKPISILTGEELNLAKANTLGETVAGEAGVQSTFFGVGVGRPIIRGQEGSRVQVLANSMLTGDVSTVSADHAVTLEPFLANQIETLRGPAVLLYGSGAIAGAVNVVDGRVPTEVYSEALGGRAELSYNSNNDGYTGMGRLDGNFANDSFSWHVDFVTRDFNDYEIPGYAFSKDLIDEELAEGETLDEFAKDEQPNSNLTADSFAVGLSWFGEKTWLGASYTDFKTNYGIPPGAHAHEEVDSDEEHEVPEFVRIDLSQNRFDMQGGISDVSVFKNITIRLANTDYEHIELEGSETGTQFFSNTFEARLEAVQNQWKGWDGAFGIQYIDNDFEAVGDEAFVPPTATTDWGFFLMQEREFGAFKLELGARYDSVSVKPDNIGATEQNFDLASFSIGGIWKFNELFHITLNLDSAQRAPTAEELFADGPHVATGLYEIGNENLDKETSTGGDLGLHFHTGEFELSVSVFRTEYDDFTYLQEDGNEQDELPVALWTQTDATFKGWEVQGSWDFLENNSGLWTLNFLADHVKATQANGDYLPRIAPGRIGTDIEWQLGNWSAGLGILHVYDQKDVAIDESSTEGYNWINANIAFNWKAGGTDMQLFLDGTNLGNEEARVATSYLKDFAPLPGRTIEAGLRIYF